MPTRPLGLVDRAWLSHASSQMAHYLCYLSKLHSQFKQRSVLYQISLAMHQLKNLRISILAKGKCVLRMWLYARACPKGAKIYPKGSSMGFGRSRRIILLGFGTEASVGCFWRIPRFLPETNLNLGRGKERAY